MKILSQAWNISVISLIINVWSFICNPHCFCLLDVYCGSKSSMNPLWNEMFHQFICKEYVNTNSAILLFALKFLVISLIKFSCIYYRQDPKTLSFLKMFIWQFLLFLLSVLHVHVWTIISLKCLSSDSFHVSLLFHSIMYLALHDNSW